MWKVTWPAAWPTVLLSQFLYTDSNRTPSLYHSLHSWLCNNLLIIAEFVYIASSLFVIRYRDFLKYYFMAVHGFYSCLRKCVLCKLEVKVKQLLQLAGLVLRILDLRSPRFQDNLNTNLAIPSALTVNSLNPQEIILLRKYLLGFESNTRP